MNTNSPEWKEYIKKRNETLDLQMEIDGETYNYPSRLPHPDLSIILLIEGGKEVKAKRTELNGHEDDWCVITEDGQEICGRWKWRYE